MAAFRPTETVSFVKYDPYPPVKVVSLVEGAVPPSTNSRVSLLCLVFGIYLVDWRVYEAELLSTS